MKVVEYSYMAKPDITEPLSHKFDFFGPCRAREIKEIKKFFFVGTNYRLDNEMASPGISDLRTPTVTTYFSTVVSVLYII